MVKRPSSAHGVGMRSSAAVRRSAWSWWPFAPSAPWLVGEGVVAAVVLVAGVDTLSMVLLEGVLGPDEKRADAAGDELAAVLVLSAVDADFLKEYGERPVTAGDHIELERPLSNPPAIVK